MINTPDVDIRQRIEQLLVNDKRTKDAVIDVAYLAGQVTLTGQVAKSDQKAAAEELARSVAGVLSVNNELRVR